MKMKNEEMMMRRTYLSFIHYILFISVVLLAGCAGEDKLATGSDTLSGEGKTPLRIEATLSSGSGITRAADKTFVEGDQLKVYLRHTTGNTKGSYTSVTADQAPRLVTLTKASSAAMTTTADANIDATDDLSASYTSTGSTIVNKLYWDDFSNSAAEDTDLRTSGHGLQSYYGYCYNGGTPTTALVEETGVLGWTVQTDQQTNGCKTSDLLWSNEQETVIYQHADARTGDHRSLTIPFTHAMSEITVTLTAAEGFSGNPLTNTELTLNGMKTTATLTAPAGTITTDDGTTTIKMAKGTYSTGLTREFTAIIAPGTVLTEGDELLVIDKVDDNKYTLTITASMLDSETAWAKDHKTADPVQTGTNGSGKKYVITQPGVNYHLNVTVNKTIIQTHATLADWKTVNATGTGDIVYPNDETNDLLVMDDSETPGQSGINVVAVDKNKFSGSPASSFSLFQLESNSTTSSANNRTNDVYSFATVSTFQDNAGDDNDQWINTPTIYWPNQSTNYYFRALAKFNSATNEVNSISSVGTYNTDKGTAVSQGTIGDGHDILWGTTAKHKGTKDPEHPTVYDRGQAIPPRTGDVPIAFEHAMSKITFGLETAAGEVSANTPAVNLSGATIAIKYIYTGGTINIENGNIDPSGDRAVDAIGATSSLSNYIVVPQDIADAAKVIITLTDGTTYSLQLNLCKDDNGTPENPNDDTAISTWARGKHYTYHPPGEGTDHVPCPRQGLERCDR